MKHLVLGNYAKLKIFSAARFQTDTPGRHCNRIQPSYEILFSRNGYLGIEEDGVEFVVERGQAILIFPGTEIRGTLQFQPDMILNFVHFDIEGAADAGDESIRVPQYTFVRRPERLVGLFHLLIEEQAANGLDGSAQRLLTRLVLHELAISAVPGCESPAPRSVPQELADRAANWIAEHVSEDISTKDVAVAMSNHPNYLSRVFREHHGLTVVEHIHARRIELARNMLIAGTAPIRTIALACGFNDEGYFRRIFRRYTGMTPRVFRSVYSPASGTN